MSSGPVRILLTVGENVAVPVVVYLLLSGSLDWAPVWALVGAAATSVLLLAVRYAVSRQLTTLGLLVLLRFLLDIAIALVTGDARLQLAKDFAITAVIGLVAAGSLLVRRPLIARIRRDLAGDPAGFDRSWDLDPGFRAIHRRLSLVWSAGLLAEAAAGIAIAYTLPLTAAVVLTSVLAPATLFTLITLTEVRVRRHQARTGRPERSRPADVP